MIIIRLVLLLFIMNFLFSCALTGKTEDVAVVTNDLSSWSNDRFIESKRVWDSTSIFLELHPGQQITDKEKALLEQVFFLSIDGRNPEPDYRDSYTYATQMTQYGIDTDEEFHSWYLLLSALKSKQQEVDTLHNTMSVQKRHISLLKKEKRDIAATLGRLRKENQTLRDSVTEQNNVIEQLKKLEMLMEQERKRFQ